MNPGTRTWRPSLMGRLLCKGPDWLLQLNADEVVLHMDGHRFVLSNVELTLMTLRPGRFWSAILWPGAPQAGLQLPGLPHAEARSLGKAVAALIEEHRRKERAQDNAAFDSLAPAVMEWASEVSRRCQAQIHRRGWLSYAFAHDIEVSKPVAPLVALTHPHFESHCARQTKEVQAAFLLLKNSFYREADQHNRLHLARALETNRQFFDEVEQSPLTAQQREAVVVQDSRVLLIASAGSGKTSTIVAKAGYVLKHRYFAPEQILLLAFNASAAAELKQRVVDRLMPHNLPGDRVATRTVHALGLEIIGQATGQRPSLAPWIDSNDPRRELRELEHMVNARKERDTDFRTDWGMLRMVFSQDLHTRADEDDQGHKAPLFWTLNGENVKSQGELILANWLFYNGVRYEYERPYEHDTANARHRQYHPDFYLPDAGIYLEHWALDAQGRAPADFAGYKESMRWKRHLHQQHGTTLLETTTADIWSGQAFEYLAQALPDHGIVLMPDPDRPASGRRPVEDLRVLQTMRSLLAHMKSNRLSLKELRLRAEDGASGPYLARHKLFLRLFGAVHAEWEGALRETNCIDFEDMLNLATDHVRTGRWKSPYELVMVDEFQDSSHARAALVASLTNDKDHHLFAVGDDWQSINRFGGADLSVMTDFREKFGASTLLKLETTFRCPQALCDISSTFVKKNPIQIRKEVRSRSSDTNVPVRIVRVDAEEHIKSAVRQRITQLTQHASQRSARASILVLGRYGKDAAHMPPAPDDHHVSLAFRTVHKSKGHEADHVILPAMLSGSLGFPCLIENDPVLRLAMPKVDAYANAEERRLLYVALTRARQTVTLITIRGKESPFIFELAKDHGLVIENLLGEPDDTLHCNIGS